MGAALAIPRIIREYSVAGFAAFWQHLRRRHLFTKPLIDERPTTGVAEGMTYNSNAFDALEWRRLVLDNVMEALDDPNTHIIGVYGSNDEIKNTLLERVWRRIDRDKLFDVVLIATVTKKPVVKKIKEEIAGQLGFNFKEKSEAERASELRDKIKNEQKILVILCDLCKGLELGKVGIPFGTDHTGCKILLTSASEKVLSNQMHTQKTFMV